MSKTIVDFYLGRDGPTIRIDAQETTAIKSLLHAFESLSLRTGERVDVTRLPGFVFTERIGGLVLASVPSSARKKVIRTSPKEAVATFAMNGAVDDWADAKYMIAPLLKGTPSHQYFSAVPPDDAVVEIALMEKRPVWAKKF